MTDHDCKQSYEETFYIIPRRIRKLPKITLAYLDVYETMFQFWNKQLPCFLSNATIQERTSLGHTVVSDALKFFEEHGELERKIHNGRRYLIQTMRIIETDTPPANAAPPSRKSGTPPPASPVHNIKKELNKEKDVVCETPTQQSQKEKIEHQALTDEKNIKLFESKFANRDITIQELFKACQSFNAPKNRWVDAQLFNKWLVLENPDNFTKKGSHDSNKKNKSQSMDVLESAYNNYYNSWVEVDCRNKGHKSLTKDEWIAKNVQS